MCVCVCVCVCAPLHTCTHFGCHIMHVKVREQLAKAGSLASLCGSQELNSGLSDVMARHLLLHTEQSHQPSQDVKNDWNHPYLCRHLGLVILTWFSVTAVISDNNVGKKGWILVTIVRHIWVKSALTHIVEEIMFIITFSGGRTDCWHHYLFRW